MSKCNIEGNKAHPLADFQNGPCGVRSIGWWVNIFSQGLTVRTNNFVSCKYFWEVLITITYKYMTCIWDVTSCFEVSWQVFYSECVLSPGYALSLL